MNTEISIDNYKIGPNYPPFIVAEISANHKGSLQHVLKTIEEVKLAGVHAIKLQTYTPDTITINSKDPRFVISDDLLWKGKTLYDLYQEAHTPWQWHEAIFKQCRELGLTVFSTPFDETAVDFLETLNVPCYKVASLEIVDLPLIQKIAQTGKPLIMSTGGATLDEISEAVQAARQAGCKDLILLKCTTAYPASPVDSNLRTLPDLSQHFDALVGLSDHTISLGVPIASVALGACLIEKHVTLSRGEGIDEPFSMEPGEFKILVEETRKAWEALGKVCYQPVDAELPTLKLRPSLFFIEDLPTDTVIESKHIRSLRPNLGLSPKESTRVLGSKLTRPVQKGTPVTWDILKK